MRLQRDDEIALCDEIAADREFWRKLRNQAVALIEEAHRRNPERAGLDVHELRSTLRIQEPDVFEALTSDLCAGAFVRKGSAIACTSHRPALPAELQPLERKIREALSEKPFDPPSRREIESDSHARQVVRFLIESRDAIEISPDVMLLRKNFEGMKARIADFISKSGPATVSEFRSASHVLTFRSRPCSHDWPEPEKRPGRLARGRHPGLGGNSPGHEPGTLPCDAP